MKKVLAICLIVCIFGSCSSAAALGAGGVLGERVYNTLIGCEVISEEDSAEMDQPVTRKEAAELMIRLQFLESAAGALAGTSQFLDVVPSDPYAPYIALCSDLGIISGDGDGYFRPDEPLLLEEGTKLLVSCLGYDAAARQEGGFPNGYMSEAKRLSLFYGVDMSGSFSKGGFYTMIYNAMEAKALLPDYNESGTAHLDEKTFGERLMEQKNIITGEDCVIGNIRYSVVEDNTVDARHVRIGEKQFVLGEISIPEILGRTVTYYAVLNQNDEYELTHVFKARNEREIRLTGIAEPSWASGQIEFYDQSNGRKKSVKLAEQCRYIYNGRPAALPADGKAEGNLLLVDHDGSGQYDLAVETDAKTYRISYIKADKGVLHFNREAWYADAEMPKGLKELTEEDEERVIQIENSAGEKLDLADLSVEDVVTVMASLDGKHVYIRREENKIEGSVTAITDETVGIDGETYTLAKEDESRKPFGIGRLGMKGTFFFNDEGQIIYFVKETGVGESYGYIADIAMTGALSPEVMIKLVRPGRIQYFEEAYDDGTTDRYLKAANDGLEVHCLKSRLTVDGESAEAEQLVKNGVLKQGMVIRYEQNSEGLIHKIYFPAAYYGADARSSLRKFVTFSDSKAASEEEKTVFAFSAINKGGFKVSGEESAVFCVPPLAGEEQLITGDPNYTIQNDDDYFDQIKMNNDTSYYTRAYDFEEETGNVRVFLIASGLNADRSDDVLQNESWSILESKAITANQDGEFVYSLSGYSEGKKFSAESLPNDANGLSRQLEDLLPGDVFKFVRNTQGKIFELSPRGEIFSISTEIPDSSAGFYSRDAGNLYGRVSKIDRKIIDEATTRYAHVIDVDYGDGVETITASYTDTAIYTYNIRRKTVEAATADDIYSDEEAGAENGTMIFAKVDMANNAQIIVIAEQDLL